MLMTTMLNNSGNYGIPLQQLAFASTGRGAEATGYHIFVMLVQNVAHFTLGVLLAAGRGKRPWKENLLHVAKFPALYALAAALATVQIRRLLGDHGRGRCGAATLLGGDLPVARGLCAGGAGDAGGATGADPSRGRPLSDQGQPDPAAGGGAAAGIGPDLRPEYPRVPRPVAADRHGRALLGELGPAVPPVRQPPRLCRQGDLLLHAAVNRDRDGGDLPGARRLFAATCAGR